MATGWTMQHLLRDTAQLCSPLTKQKLRGARQSIWGKHLSSNRKLHISTSETWPNCQKKSKNHRGLLYYRRSTEKWAFSSWMGSPAFLPWSSSHDAQTCSNCMAHVLAARAKKPNASQEEKEIKFLSSPWPEAAFPFQNQGFRIAAAAAASAQVSFCLTYGRLLMYI